MTTAPPPQALDLDAPEVTALDAPEVIALDAPEVIDLEARDEAPEALDLDAPEARDEASQAHLLLGVTLPSLDAAETALHDIAKLSGYALATHKKTPNAQTPNRAIYTCSKGGQPRQGRAQDTHEDKRHKTSSQKVACPFRIAIKKQGYNSWIVEPVKGDHSRHTYDMLEVSAFARYRTRILRVYREEVVHQRKSGNKSSQILANLRQKEPAFHDLISRDIANLLARHRREELGGKSPTEWLLSRIADDQ